MCQIAREVCHNVAPDAVVADSAACISATARKSIQANRLSGSSKNIRSERGIGIAPSKKSAG
jgi:hypothetical protein